LIYCFRKQYTGRRTVTLLLADTDVRTTIEMRSVISGLDRCMREEADGRALAPPRMNTQLDGSWIRFMPAIIPSMAVMGYKEFHGNPAYGARFLVVLCSITSGEVLALLDSTYLTAARTAATSAVAARYMARNGPWRIAVIGSGLEAETHCLAMAAMNSIKDVRVFSPNRERREAFAARMTARLDLSGVACNDPVSAVTAADHVVVATNTGTSRAIAYFADWLEPGQHISAIGSTNPRLRELDTNVFRRADTLVFDARSEQIQEESGDVLAFCDEGGSIDRGLWLPHVVSGTSNGRTDDDEITLFKSVGSALQDVVAAVQVYESAKKQGLGVEVVDLAQLKPPTIPN
jgi:alanine dehydrogenase